MRIRPVTQSLFPLMAAALLLQACGQARKPETRESGLGADCMDQMQAIEAWNREHPDEARDLRERFSQVQRLLDAGEYDAALAPMTDAFAANLTAAGGDPRCAEPIARLAAETVRALADLDQPTRGDPDPDPAE